jgi:hypothetical protein
MENEKKKTGYQSTWQDQLKDTANKIINREKFSYDLNGDALYKQYKDRYIQQGKQAMMDTMGQAQAMTGGYGNSYAQTVGQQTYQGYLQGLNDQVPQLYQIALDKYTREGADMRDNMNMMMQQDNIDYGRYRDQLADQDAAFNKLLALMEGYKYQPTAEEMAAAGMTEAQMRAILGLPDPSAGSSGGGGGKVGGKGAYVIPGTDKVEIVYGPGVDAGEKGTYGNDDFDYVKTNLKQMVNSGNTDAVDRYMTQLSKTLNKEQIDEAIKIVEKKK